MIDHEVVNDLSTNNKEKILGSKKCGCYHCLAKFSPDEIREWFDYDKTAVCPRCRVDSVIPLDHLENGQATKELQEMNQNYFSCYDDDFDEYN